MSEENNAIPKKEEKTVLVDGNAVPYSRFLELKQDPNIRITEVASGVYKTLTRMQG
jgi:hypothetical protein